LYKSSSNQEKLRLSTNDKKILDIQKKGLSNLL